MRGAFESEGDIRSVDLLSALVLLWRERAGGALRFSRSGATAGFDLAGGELVATLSSQPQFDTAAILVRAGKLDPASVERIEIPDGGDAALAAMQAGLITAREMRWGQKIRAVEVLSDLLGWLEGEYVREAGEASSPSGDWTLPLPRLVLELFLRSRDRTLVEHFLGAPDLPLVKAPGFEEEFESFGLTSDAGAVVALIDGQTSAEEIAESSNADEFAVLKLLAALTTLGLVHPREAAAAADRGVPAAIRESKRGKIPSPVEPPVEKEEAPADLEAEAVDDMPEEPESEPEEAPLEAIAEEPLALPEDTERAGSEPVEPPQADAEPVPSLPPAPRPESLEPAQSPPEYSELPLLETPAGDPVFDLGGGEPHGSPKRGSAAVLLGLLGVLVIAVAVLLVSRSRGVGRGQTPPASERPTPADNAVFPAAETAVPLPTAARSRPPTRTAQPLAAAAPATPVPTRIPPTPPPTAVPTRAAPTKPPTAVPTRAAPTKPPTAIPTRAAPTKAPTAIPTRAAPTKAPTAAPNPPPTRVAARIAPVPTAVAPRAEATRAEWLRRAERDRQALLNRRGVRYSVQLELACEPETLQKAWNWDKPSGTIWLLTTSYRGRTCFRVLWGRYGSLAQAREGRKRVPEFFAAPGNRPTIVSVR